MSILRHVRLVLVLALAAASPVAAAEAVPNELLSESVLSQYRAIPTCAGHGGEPLAAARAVGKSDLLVGYDDGAIVVFQLDPQNLNTPAFRVNLTAQRPIDDLCGVRPVSRRSATQDAFAIALQGAELTLVSTESIRALDTWKLPGPSGRYGLTIINASQRVFVHDDVSVSEIRVLPDGGSWKLVVEPIAVPAGSRVAVVGLPDRLFVVGEASVTEISDSGTETLPATSGALCSPEHQVFSCAAPGWIALACAEGESGRVSFLHRTPTEWTTGVTRGLSGTPTAAAALDDATAVLAGRYLDAANDTLGWIALLSPSGQQLAWSDHPVPVAYLATLDDWVIAHGKRSNLSVYNSRLDPIWDHASQVMPVALLVENFDGLGYSDVAVVGTEEQYRKRSDVDSMRVLLRRPDLFADAELVGTDADGSGGAYFRRASRAVLFINNREHFEEALASSSRGARLYLGEGRAEDARDSAILARAAAAVLGLRSEVREQTRVLVEARALPARRRHLYVWAVALLMAGIWMSALYLRDRSDRVGLGIATAGALAVALVVASVLRRPPHFGFLFVGGGVPLATLLATAGRRSLEYSALKPGAPIEELSRSIMAFIHGGQGDFSSELGGKVNDDARKNITQLAYLAREMMDARGVPDRFAAMRNVLAKSADTFRESVLPEVAHLAEMGRRMGFMAEPLSRMETASRGIDASLRSILSEPSPEPTEFAEHLRVIKDARQRLVDSAEAVRDAVVSNPGCSLNSVLDDVMTLRADFIASHGVEAELNSAVKRSADAVRGSRYVIFTIIENLVTNGVKAMKDSAERRLSVSAESDGRRCAIRLADTGRGMSYAERDALFVEHDDSQKGGFGLPYSRLVIRQLGGEISVSSEVGSGTTVLVEIPHWNPACIGDDDE